MTLSLNTTQLLELTVLTMNSQVHGRSQGLSITIPDYAIIITQHIKKRLTQVCYIAFDIVTCAPCTMSAFFVLLVPVPLSSALYHLPSTTPTGMLICSIHILRCSSRTKKIHTLGVHVVYIFLVLDEQRKIWMLQISMPVGVVEGRW